MSAETWKQEFYPCQPSPLMSKEEAIRHSLRKWEGLRTASLKKHGLSVPPLGINGATCSLCVKYREQDNDLDKIEEDDYADHVCHLCPLYETLGQQACDHRPEEDINEDEPKAPFHAYHQDYDPEPMIAALKKTLENCLEKEREP